jgi:hypothetical protein
MDVEEAIGAEVIVFEIGRRRGWDNLGMLGFGDLGIERWGEGRLGD